VLPVNLKPVVVSRDTELMCRREAFSGNHIATTLRKNTSVAPALQVLRETLDSSTTKADREAAG
jgi:hypothetical protein